MVSRSLVICEKPSAAKRIAIALDDNGRPESYREDNVPYYIASRGGMELVVVSALGHLYTIVQDGGEWTYPVYNYKWAPTYQASDFVKRSKSFIDVINMHCQGIDEYVSACDYDVEGSLIAYNILRYTCGPTSLDRASRMRYSTLTETDLVKAWEDRDESLDYTVIAAGKARHEVDWLFGINLSRALTLSVKSSSGYFKTLSIGRVQGPTLDFIREREVEINGFVPSVFWIIQAETMLNGKAFSLAYDRERIESEDEAKKITSRCRGREGAITEITSSRRKRYPPPPFNLGDLQREAYRHYRYSPRTTLQSAERLYIDAYISYPRTDSQRIPPNINIMKILRQLRRRGEYREEVESLLSRSWTKPRNGKKEDPAHPAIHPTGKLPRKLRKTDYRIFDLVCRRFMACFGEPALRENVNAKVDVRGYIFHLRGNRFLKQGWMKLYGRYAKYKEVLLPALREGMILPVTKIGYRRRYTKPPRRYNPRSLLELMEEQGLGTKATRTDIIDTLHKRGYVRGRNIEMTDLGFAVAESLERYCPDILSVEMTRNLEEGLEDIQSGKLMADNIVHEAVKTLGPILDRFREHEEEIGGDIDQVLKKLAEERRMRSILGDCPSCETGKIKVVVSRKTGKRFAGCSNYENSCGQTYPLPQRGKIVATGETCEYCGSPIIEVKRRGWKPWRLCINMECDSKDLEKRDEK